MTVIDLNELSQPLAFDLKIKEENRLQAVNTNGEVTDFSTKIIGEDGRKPDFIERIKITNCKTGNVLVITNAVLEQPIQFLEVDKSQKPKGLTSLKS